MPDHCLCPLYSFFSGLNDRSTRSLVRVPEGFVLLLAIPIDGPIRVYCVRISSGPFDAPLILSRSSEHMDLIMENTVRLEPSTSLLHYECTMLRSPSKAEGRIEVK